MDPPPQYSIQIHSFSDLPTQHNISLNYYDTDSSLETGAEIKLQINVSPFKEELTRISSILYI